ncbi:MAG: hypothetical protein WAM03_01020, partial [Pseudolabrys sp.]
MADLGKDVDHPDYKSELVMAYILALAQQRRLAPSGKCNSVFDTYSAAVCLIEHGATGLVANGKN